MSTAIPPSTSSATTSSPIRAMKTSISHPEDLDRVKSPSSIVATSPPSAIRMLTSGRSDFLPPTTPPRTSHTASPTSPALAFASPSRQGRVYHQILAAELNREQIELYRTVTASIESPETIESVCTSSFIYALENRDLITPTEDQSLLIGGGVFLGATVGTLGGPPGMLAGAGVGFAVTFLPVMYTNIRAMTDTREFRFWREQRIEILREQAIKDFLGKDSLLRFLRCPITGEIPEMPFTAREKTFELNAVTTWLKRNPGQTFPGCTSVFSEHDLAPDFTHMVTVIERIESITKAAIHHADQTISALIERLDVHLAAGPETLKFIVVSYAMESEKHKVIIWCMRFNLQLKDFCKKKVSEANVKFQDDRRQLRAIELQLNMKKEVIHLDCSLLRWFKSKVGIEPNVRVITTAREGALKIENWGKSWDSVLAES